MHCFIQVSVLAWFVLISNYANVKCAQQADFASSNEDSAAEITEEEPRGRTRSECMEKFACELSRMGRGNMLNPTWMKKVFGRPPKFGFMERISRASRRGTNCAQYRCKAVSSMKRTLDGMMKRSGQDVRRVAKIFSTSNKKPKPSRLLTRS